MNRSRLQWQEDCLEALSTLQSKLRGKTLMGKTVDVRVFKQLQALITEDINHGIGYDPRSTSAVRNSPYYRLVKLVEGHKPASKFLIQLLEYHTNKKYVNVAKKVSVKNFLEVCKYKTEKELTDVLTDPIITNRFKNLPTVK
jgi:hypothetical protein